jgi:hypothetical protein
MNKANTVMVAILVTLATTTGLATTLSIMSQQTALAIPQGSGGGCGVGGCGGAFSGHSVFTGGLGAGGSGSGVGQGFGNGDLHCGGGQGGTFTHGTHGGGGGSC